MSDILLCPDTYELARGLTLGSHSSPLLVAATELYEREVFPFLDASACPFVEVVLFFLPQQGGWISTSSSSSSLSSVEECVLASSDVTSEVRLRWRPLLVPGAFFLAFFFGTS